ncbi:MAG: Hsp70 family protein, partial [Candidatus Saccharibacteria bacterium]|nr:Hsp70 family protein [Candidatus Saccharibacteria bacterium]
MSSNNNRDESIIRIGIDLGTTNSEIAYCDNDEIEILKNAQGMDYTPSVFGISKSGNKIVGKIAYDKLFSGSKEDYANIKREVKRLMGTNEKIHFSRANRDFTPEEISSEIIIHLKENISRKYPDAKQIAAVITIPAHFESLQCEATKRAGELAGFDYVELVQEPIAAAISHGFDDDSNTNILVYDLGGGTFDVALISSNDGILKVVGHGGDNYLGGKDIDRILVDDVI